MTAAGAPTDSIHYLPKFGEGWDPNPGRHNDNQPLYPLSYTHKLSPPQTNIFVCHRNLCKTLPDAFLDNPKEIAVDV
ncbi:hypothetical protein Y032_0201g1744 [Ancylostoma ceylanicum]|uniref:Uncharacterized protein n=1 Tax=Ancylostoma ceylanicum TaxID=53326 RepID=A0A016SNF4_9BILA|nr:hypothetical protein Y032_0201g1744 [Ancylostoma ceylanicum]